LQPPVVGRGIAHSRKGKFFNSPHLQAVVQRPWVKGPVWPDGVSTFPPGTKVFCLHGDAHSESERYAAAAWQAEIFGWQQLYAPGVGKYLTQIYVLGGQLKSSGECSNIVWAFPMPQ
jgi:hypothetical protein